MWLDKFVIVVTITNHHSEDFKDEQFYLSSFTFRDAVC
jgi:hypothetical protein